MLQRLGFTDCCWKQLIILKLALIHFKIRSRNDVETQSSGIIQMLNKLDRIRRLQADQRHYITELVHFSLWGNRSDLSQMTMDRGQSGSLEDQFMLVDDTDSFRQELMKGPREIHFVVDNAGIELLSDLGLAAEFLSADFAERIVLHVKAHPMFVSDATRQDVAHLLEFISHNNSSLSNSFGNELRYLMEGNKLMINEDPFWNSPITLL